MRDDLAVHIANLVLETGQRHEFDFHHIMWKSDPFKFQGSKKLDALIGHFKGLADEEESWWILRIDLNGDLPLAAVGRKVGKEDSFGTLAREKDLRAYVYGLISRWPEEERHRVSKILYFLDDLAQQK